MNCEAVLSPLRLSSAAWAVSVRSRGILESLGVPDLGRPAPGRLPPHGLVGGMGLVGMGLA